MIRNKHVKHEDFLYKRLQDDQYAIDYLNACLEDEDQAVFLLALRDVIKARNGNMSQIAQDAQLARENIYVMLSQDGNPNLKSLRSLFNAIGFQLQIAPKDHAKIS